MILISVLTRERPHALGRLQPCARPCAKEVIDHCGGGPLRAASIVPRYDLLIQNIEDGLEAVAYRGAHSILRQERRGFPEQLRTGLADFKAAYKFTRRLKTLGRITPYEHVCKVWTSEPDRFILDAIHQRPGLNT